MARRKTWLLVIGAIGVFLAVIFGAIAFLNPRLTRYVESDRFRAELEKETAKGLHFPIGRFAPIGRTGSFTAASDRFQAEHGRKALRALDARGITATFNPWAVFLRRWQLDEVHIQSGEVEIQVYEPTPEPTPRKAWFAIFLPERVYLKRVESEPVDVTWRFRGGRGGFSRTRLLITPRGRDFNYQATGGKLRMALIPDLYLRQTHLLITKKLLTLYDLELAPDAEGGDSIHTQGKAGTGQDKSVDFAANFDRIPIGPWLPSGWKEHFTGAAAGRVHWQGKSTKLEDSSGDGALRLGGAKLENLPFLQKLATLAQKSDLAQLNLNDCSLDCAWIYPKINLKNIAIEEKGKFRIEGEISVNRKSLGGALELGVARKYLDWLPKPEEIFTREQRGYLWATVHLSGTVDDPKQDLSPRIAEVLKESPGAYLKLLFRQFGAWLKKGIGD
jgi:hypothetical protein